MLITDDESIYLKVSQLCVHGAAKSDLVRHQEKGGSLLPDFTMRGYNYRMTDFQGALGVCQMQKAQEIMAGRRQIAKQYNEALAKNTSLQLPSMGPGFVHGYQSYVTLFTQGCDLTKLTVEKIDQLNIQRNEVMQRLEARGIATRQGTHAVHTLDYYSKRYQLNKEAYLNAYAADRLSMTLPLYAQMTPEEFDYVVTNLNEVIQCAV